jgi:eukaryotic-like serine/threonine-protein kinase
VGLYARLLGFVFGGLYLLGAGATLALAPELFWPVHSHPAKWANLALALLGFSCFVVVRRPRCSESAVLAVDVALPLTINAVMALALLSLPAGYGLQFVPVLILVISLIFRAALVPSPTARTAVIGVLASLPVIAAEYLFSGRDTGLPSFLGPGAITFAVGAWCVVVTLGTALVSREIYGLRHEIAQARRLGQYTLERLIGEGGMGSVYVARHALLRRPTAIKLLTAERAGPENIARFEREVQLTSSLTHPNTVAVYDYGRTPEGTFYYAMEYIPGLSLEELVQRYGCQPPARVVHILLQALDALAEAHGVGLVHRDVKPANILLCQRGGQSDVVKLVDFGLVKDLSHGGPSAVHSRAQKLTGTPLYIAPESISEPELVDHRADLYGLGGVAYFLLTATPPFEGHGVIEICSHHLHTPPTPPSLRLGRALPQRLEAVVLACLAKKPGERPADARILHEQLRQCALELPWTQADAEAWWQAHVSEIAESRQH